MPADLLAELVRLAVAGAVVAAFAVPAGAVGFAVSRLLRQPILPRWRHTPESWTGLDVLFLFGVYLVLPVAIAAVLDRVGFFQAVYGPEFPRLTPPGDDSEARKAAVQTAGLWGLLLGTPVLAGAAVLIRILAHERPFRLTVPPIPARVALGVLAWVFATPVIFTVSQVANWLVILTGGEPDQHPLTQLGVGPTAFDQVLFGLVVCVVAPFAEELLCRGLLLRWAAGRSYRPWVLLGLVVPIGYVRGGPAPAAFAVVLAGGWWLVWVMTRGRRFPTRTVAATVATAALFAVGHGGVWPTPVPLFVLGLTLGYLAARTRGITACVVLHGLFNAVSFVYLLRGGPGG